MNAPPPPEEKKKPLLTVRPFFSPAIAMLEAAPITVAAATALSCIGGVFLMVLLSNVGLGEVLSGGTIFIVLFVLGIVVFPPAYFELKRKACRRTICNFYEEYLEYQDFAFLISRRRGRVGYQDVQDVFHHANTLQQREKLLTLYVEIPSLGEPYRRDGHVGLKLANIANGDAVSGRIVNILDDSRRRALIRMITPVLPPAAVPAENASTAT